jgi:uroporphyrinogen decarboxylase
MDETNTTRERLNAILHYKPYDKMPLLHFGFWPETLEKWSQEGHLTNEEMEPVRNMGVYTGLEGTEAEARIAQKVGFDDNYLDYPHKGGLGFGLIQPPFEPKIIKELDDGHLIKCNTDGVYVKTRKGVVSIEEEIDHTLKDRDTWEKFYKPRLAWDDEKRFAKDEIKEFLETNKTRKRRICVFCGSLIGKLRNYWGLVELSYLQFDDPDLFDECINTVAETCYTMVKKTLETGIQFDFGHFWEDICYNHGPLIQPEIFKSKAGKHYRRIADEFAKYGIDIISVDCDGYIEDLVPAWLDNGVNTMFPLEYGAWEYDFETMRKKFGKELRGIGNINKKAFSQDRKAVDHEIERAKRLVDLGGFVPCPDHWIPIDSEWDLVRYYCDKMKEAFWK